MSLQSSQPQHGEQHVEKTRRDFLKNAGAGVAL